MNITLDMTSKYEILSHLPGQKTKPIQSQFKPIASKAKIDAKCVFTKNYEEKADRSYKKTKPEQSQFKANFKIPDRICSLSSSENVYNANGSTCKRLDTLNILS